MHIGKRLYHAQIHIGTAASIDNGYLSIAAKESSRFLRRIDCGGKTDPLKSILPGIATPSIIGLRRGR